MLCTYLQANVYHSYDDVYQSCANVYHSYDDVYQSCANDYQYYAIV